MKIILVPTSNDGVEEVFFYLLPADGLPKLRKLVEKLRQPEILMYQVNDNYGEYFMKYKDSLDGDLGDYLDRTSYKGTPKLVDISWDQRSIQAMQQRVIVHNNNLISFEGSWEGSIIQTDLLSIYGLEELALQTPEDHHCERYLEICDVEDGKPKYMCCICGKQFAD